MASEAEVEAAARAIAAWVIVGSTATVDDIYVSPFSDESPHPIWKWHIVPARAALEAAERVRREIDGLT